MTSAYLSPLSLEPVRLLAGFKKERGSYYLERQVLSPPEELCTQVFPEVDHYWEQFTSGQLAEDIAAVGFLRMMRYIRTVVLQDAAVLMDVYKDSIVWQQPIFRSLAFHDFRLRLQSEMARSESPFSIQLQQVLPQVHDGLQGIQRSISVANAQVQEAQQRIPAAIRGDVSTLLADLQERLATCIDSTVSAAIDRERLHLVRDSVQRYANNCTSEIDRLLELPSVSVGEASTSVLAPVPSIAHMLPASTSSSQPPPLPYKQPRQITGIAQIWQEWRHGLNGGPAVQDLERFYRSKWRTLADDRKLFSRRKIVIDHIIFESESRQCPPEDIVQELEEEMRDNALSLTALENKLSLQRKERHQ
jgi:hypothetical protein